MLKPFCRLDERNLQERKTCIYFSLSQLHFIFHRCNAPFQTREMKNFWPLCFFKSCKCICNATWVTLNHKNVIHSESKQLHFNAAWNECYLKLVWSEMKVISTQCWLVSNEYVLKCCLKSAAQYRPWNWNPLELLKFVYKNMKWSKNMFWVH